MTAYAFWNNNLLEILSGAIHQTSEFTLPEDAWKKEVPNQRFIEIPDYHSACAMMTTTGIPSYHLQPGRNKFRGRQVQLEPEALKQFQDALANFVAYL